MPITTFAAIDIGAGEVSMKLYEISKKTGITELDHVRRPMELGSQSYTEGRLSHALVNELCDILKGFVDKMREYGVADYTACTTSALREASNNILILDQIRLKTGLKVKIISNSEQRFLCYKAIALREPDFEKIIEKGTALVDVGSGSIQITLLDKGVLLSTQNIKLGSLRIRELLSRLEDEADNFRNLISEYINHDLLTYRSFYLEDNKIRHIIGMGEQMTGLFGHILKTDLPRTINREDFERLYRFISSKSTEEISLEYSISRDQACLILPTAMIYRQIFACTAAEAIWISGITLCDGIAAEYAEKKEKIAPAHDFTEDILRSAREIARRYHSNTAHTENVEYIALQVFDKIRKIHGMGKRERLLLQIAVILHSCGEYINMEDVHENSYKIIMSTEIIGISHQEREIAANIVRYNVSGFPKYTQLIGGMEKETYIKISKLTAILRISNAMDKSHRQKFSNIRITLKDNKLIITADTREDIELEKGLFDKKADFFEEVYGIRPVLKQKRSM